MRIQHNIMAMNAFRNYNTNTSALGRNLEKLSSGYKINRAGDDAAGLAISEKMRAQISGLKQAQSNVKDGISLVKTAEGALQEVQDMLNRMTTLATQSANGTYDNNVDRNNLQKEVAALAEEIDRIADSSNFNGTKLLDGSMGAAASAANAKEATAATTSFTANTANLTAAGLTDMKVSGDATTAGNITAAYTAESTSKSATTITVAGKDFTVTGDAATTLNGKTIKVVFDNSIESSANAAVVGADGNVTVTLSVKDSTAQALIDTDSKLVTVVNAVLSNATGSAGDVLNAWKATTIATATTGTYTAPTANATATSTAMADGGNVTAAKIVLTDADSKTYTATAGAADGKFANDEALTFASADGGTLTISAKVADKSKINDTNVDTKAFGATTITGTATAASVDLDFTGKTGAGVIGSAVTIGNKTYEFVKTGDAAKIANAVAVSVAENADAAAIVDAFVTATGGAYNDEQGTAAGTVAETAGKDTSVTLTSTATGANAEIATIEQLGKGLGLQIGDTAESYNQLAVKVGDMHTKALGVDISSISVATQEDAAKAIEAIKTAINTVSGTRGDLGAIQNRLEHTTNNLAIMTENIQDAESTIRDVDIADEMTAYTKNNILLQSAQAMLAQANQMPQGVLQLLQ